MFSLETNKTFPHRTMACRHMGKVIYGAKHLMAKRNGALHLNAQLYHSSEEFHEQPFPPESKWHQKAFLS
ncbi:hypothetical protein DVH24_012170 [Malus domestica]|uniref:Uncharacterized protein n=1 Tax=Malus domestica TaxID=3750 RepID=A0A498HLZ4_MALDO|nr:hypothetical protein DVH24_012170 [Malus domestica]